MTNPINFKKGEAVPDYLKQAWGIHPSVKIHFKADMQVLKNESGNYITRIGASENEEHQNFSVGDCTKRMCL
jgi:hypothetical protein